MKTSKPKNVTIDGPAGTGKTTLSSLLAERLGYQKLDTGAFYRAVTVQAIKESALDDESKCIELAKRISVKFDKDTNAQQMFIDSVDCTHELRTPEVNRNVSRTSAFPGVRHVIVEQLQQITSPGGFVAEGFSYPSLFYPLFSV